MDPNTVQAFSAIKQFVAALAEIYDVTREVSPLLLYKRLLTFVKSEPREQKNIRKFLQGFVRFYQAHNTALVSNKLKRIPRGTRIPYSKNAYIDIQKFIYKAADSPETLKQIRVHLLTIQAFLESDDTKAELLLQEVSAFESTAEDKFVGSIVKKAQKAIEGFDPATAENPMAAVTGLMQSGVLTDMVMGLQTRVGSGEMDPAKLLQSMQGTMSKVLAESTPSLADFASDSDPESDADAVTDVEADPAEGRKDLRPTTEGDPS